MSKKIYTVEDVVQMVNCCYFVGSCKTCPCWKPTGYAGIGKCIGATEVGNVLLGILEPIMERERAEKNTQPSLFPIEEEAPDMDAVEADPVAAEMIEKAEDPEADPEEEADAVCLDAYPVEAEEEE